MAARKRKSKSKAKKKRKSTPRTKKRTELEILKEQQSILYTKVAENLKIILKQTNLEQEQLGAIIEKYGYDAIPKLDGFDIIQPIWERMKKDFQTYDRIASLVERKQEVNAKLLVKGIEQNVIAEEAKLKAIEDEESFYSEKERDQEGMIKMKEKWFAEKEHWEYKKAEITQKLQSDPQNQQLLAKLEECERNLKELNSKRWKVRLQNIQPGIGKWSRKIGKTINTIQDSIGEVTKPFQEMGEMSGYDQKSKKNTNTYADMFSPEKVFNTKKSKDKNGWEDYF